MKCRASSCATFSSTAPRSGSYSATSLPVSEWERWVARSCTEVYTKTRYGSLSQSGSNPARMYSNCISLEPALVEQLGVAHVVVQHLAVPVLLGGPEVDPLPPVAVLAEVRGEQPVEVRQPLLREEVERHGGAGRHRNPCGRVGGPFRGAP